MGADAFLAFYGIKLALDQDDDEALDACGAATDPRCVTARRAGLQTDSGRMTSGEDCFLYIGQRLGWLGLEHEGHTSFAPERLAQLIAQTDKRLAEAGFAQPAALHLQLVAQY